MKNYRKFFLLLIFFTHSVFLEENYEELISSLRKYNKFTNQKQCRKFSPINSRK